MSFQLGTERVGEDAATDERRWLVALSLMAAVSVMFALAVGRTVGIPAVEIIMRYATGVLVLAPASMILLLIAFLVQSVVIREPSPLGRLRRALAARFGTMERAAATVIPLLLIPVVMGAFGTLKQAIPLVATFHWDDRLAAIDKFLFFGRQPWEWTHLVLDDPLSTAIIDRIYTMWIPFLFVAVLGVAFCARPAIRAQFFLAFAAAWLLVGGLGALLFSSAGPCYAALIGASSAPEFTGLMTNLQGISADYHKLGAVEWQKVLWDAHINKHYGFAMGVSAMPSMHNAICFLYVLASWRAGWLLRSAAILFTAVTFAGSIHLGWHYAVDGLGAWAMVGAIWWAAGRFLSRGAASSSARTDVSQASTIYG